MHINFLISKDIIFLCHKNKDIIDVKFCLNYFFSKKHGFKDNSFPPYN